MVAVGQHPSLFRIFEQFGEKDMLFDAEINAGIDVFGSEVRRIQVEKSIFFVPALNALFEGLVGDGDVSEAFAEFRDFGKDSYS